MCKHVPVVILKTCHSWHCQIPLWVGGAGTQHCCQWHLNYWTPPGSTLPVCYFLWCHGGKAHFPEQRFNAERERIQETGSPFSSGHNLVSDHSTWVAPWGQKKLPKGKTKGSFHICSHERVYFCHSVWMHWEARWYKWKTIFYFMAKGQLRAYKLGDMQVAGGKRASLSFE